MDANTIRNSASVGADGGNLERLRQMEFIRLLLLSFLMMSIFLRMLGQDGSRGYWISEWMITAAG